MAVQNYTDKTFFELTGLEKNAFSFLRLFNILLDNDRFTTFLNIFRSYTVNKDVFTNTSFYNTYEVGNGEFWDNVSWNLYDTPYLWWVIALINNVTNPFEELDDGQQLKVLKADFIYNIVQDLEAIAE